MGIGRTRLTLCDRELCPHHDVRQPLMQDIHNTRKNPHRMPAILRKEDHEAWLAGTLEDARGVLQQYVRHLMYAYAIGTRVNSPKTMLLNCSSR